MSISKRDCVLHGLSAIFMPNIFLFYLCNRNIMVSSMALSQILVLASLLAIVSIVLFLLFSVSVRRLSIVVLMLILWWLCFWLFEIIYKVTIIYFGTISKTLLLMLIVLGLIFAIVFFRNINTSVGKLSSFMRALSVCVIALSVFNLAPILYHFHLLGRTPHVTPKSTFLVDNSLPSPDIYWLHMDGMMSVETIEQYFDISLNHIRDSFAQRGFIFYENATVRNVADTQTAIASLLSPQFFDVYFSDLTDEVAHLIGEDRYDYIMARLLHDGVDILRDINPNNELFGAFKSAGYEIVTEMGSQELQERIENDGQLITPAHHSHLPRFIRGDLGRLMELTTPLSIIISSEQQSNYGETIFVDENSSGPKLVYIANHWAHYANWSWFDPHGVPTFNAVDADQTRIDLYSTAYGAAANYIITSVDAILEQNKQAVIVVQGDHGFHGIETQQYLLEEGYSEDDVITLLESVLSAVRIPSQFGEQDVPIAPLNIARELVNRFVGENYVLLAESN